jgi:hypothetical protein
MLWQPGMTIDPSRGADSRIFNPGPTVAFHAQQAVEKALKTALVLSDVEPTGTHDLNHPRGQLPADWRAKRRPPLRQTWMTVRPGTSR